MARTANAIFSEAYPNFMRKRYIKTKKKMVETKDNDFIRIRLEGKCGDHFQIKESKNG